MPRVNAPRPYRSAARDESASRTRQAVLAAATELFVTHGYAGTTIAQIAAQAGVSKPTVFAVGAKAHLLKLARDVAIAGDDEPTSVADRPAFHDLDRAPDPETTLRRYATISSQIGRRFARLNEVLRQAQHADPELARLWQTSEEQRLAGARMVVRMLRAKGALKPGLSPGRAAEVLWLMTDPSVQHRLVADRGWSAARFERWHADTLVALLLP